MIRSASAASTAVSTCATRGLLSSMCAISSSPAFSSSTASTTSPAELSRVLTAMPNPAEPSALSHDRVSTRPQWEDIRHPPQDSDFDHSYQPSYVFTLCTVHQGGLNTDFP